MSGDKRHFIKKSDQYEEKSDQYEQIVDNLVQNFKKLRANTSI